MAIRWRRRRRRGADRGVRLSKTVAVKTYPRRREAWREWRARLACGPSPFFVAFHRCVLTGRHGRIVMERVRGSSLRSVIRRRGPLGAVETVRLLLTLLAALEVLHRRRFVHGDLHAGNVIVTNRRAAMLKIIDFQHAVKMNRRGVARARRKLRRPPATLAPESRGRTIDARYDVYGVGFMGAAMLMGREPRRRPRATRRRRRSRLWRILLKAMHPRRGKRYPSARAMMEDLRRWLDAVETRWAKGEDPLERFVPGPATGNPPPTPDTPTFFE